MAKLRELEQLTVDYQKLQSTLLKVTNDARLYAKKKEPEHDDLIILLKAYEALHQYDELKEHYSKRIGEAKRSGKFITEEEVNVDPHLFSEWLYYNIDSYHNTDSIYLECADYHKNALGHYLASRFLTKQKCM